ncbi:MAG: 5-bromo-4-chloroindolyl phosphate hydrolysis family protein [Slackia sp.]|nr:5-bromo-4-chloroindolyl phosphate hydrolysis family protein [Slackia sp.]
MASPNNIGNQILDAVQDAVSSQDYRALQSTIEHSLGTAAENIGKGLAQASNGIRRAQEEYAKEMQRKQQQATMQTLYAKTGGRRAASIAMAGWGGVIAVPCLLGAGVLSISGMAFLIVPPILFAAGGAALALAGIRKLSLVKRFENYRDTIGVREHCTIEELAAATASQPKAVLKNVKKMLGKGLFKQAALDDSETMLIMTREGYRQYREAQMEAQHRRHQQNLAQSVAPEIGEKKPLTPEAHALLARGEAYIARIRASNDAIEGEAISKKIDQIEHVVRTIFDRAAEQPQVIDDLGKLMDYYLPTTVKLLDAYRDLDAQPVQGENILSSKREIEATLDTLSTAFEKLLDSIFRDMAWDVSSDISVLRTVLAQEGLIDSPLTPQSSPTLRL